jgi:glycosyltransferase domain-containing protein
MSALLSILVPTKDRSDYLLRLLNYFQNHEFQGKIYIGDSSEEYHFKRNQKIIEKSSLKKRIIHSFYPKRNPASCINKLLKDVDTPYATMTNDDDFLVPESLNKSVSFLEHNSKYNAAWGKAAKIRLDRKGAFGNIVKCKKMNQLKVMQNSATGRLYNFFDNPFDIVFAVHRTSCYKKMFSYTESIPDRLISENLLINMLSAVSGIIKELDCLYLIRQDHDERDFFLHRFDTFEWIVSKHFRHSFFDFQEVIAREITSIDNISFEKSKDIVKQKFWEYINIRLLFTYSEKYHIDGPEIDKKKIKQHIRKSLNMLFQPHLEKYHQTQNGIRKKMEMGFQRLFNNVFHQISKDEPISMANLKNPNSPYFMDFKELERVTQTPTISFN